MEMLYQIAQVPTEGKLFEVKPLEIDRSKFEFEKPTIIWEPMGALLCWNQKEWVRQIIKEAFAEVDKRPERYAAAFYTLIPKKRWDGYKSIAELKAYARCLGGLMANWVEQALEWAQRIDNGESWDNICKESDTVNYYRMIRWKNGHCRLVGGSLKDGDGKTVCASDMGFYNRDYYRTGNYYSSSIIEDTVPLVVIRNK